jgi:hypothetical protein
MASLVPGYEYDVFLSYSQKDNSVDIELCESFPGSVLRGIEFIYRFVVISRLCVSIKIEEYI